MCDSLITSRYEGENAACKLSVIDWATGPGVLFAELIIRAVAIKSRFENNVLGRNEMWVVNARIMTRCRAVR